MASKQLDQLIQEMENYCECWKQFHHFVNLAREKKFGPEDEAQFLEIKTIIVQELELILASVEVTSPSKEEVHNVLNLAPSLRYLSELNEAALRSIENQWHKIYIGLHAILGQLKVRQRQEEGRSFLPFRKSKEA
jgi:hypothetical protein